MLRSARQSASRSTHRVAATLIGCVASLAALAPARADDPPAQSGASSAPAAPQLRPLCTDRPTKSNGACTVDAGHFQLETDLFNATLDHSQGVTTDTYLFTNPTLKYGLTNSIDVELNISPYEEVRTHETGAAPDDATRTLYGVGDLYARLKVNLIGDDSGAFAAALFPYVKAPTARDGIGDGAWEEGLIVPLVFKLNDAWTLTFDPEVDVLKNLSDDGRHAATQQVIDLGWSATKTVTLFGELWEQTDFEAGNGVSQMSADVAASWGLPHDLQLDGGLNFGLNHVTPGVQGYVGLSKRF